MGGYFSVPAEPNELSGQNDPNGECVFNISKETTKTELCRIRGVSETMQRMQGINLSSGHTNAVEIATGLFGLPNMETMLEAFNKSRTV